MTKTHLFPFAAGLAVAMWLAGCEVFPSDFPVAVGNRTASTVTVFANGEQLGEVGSNQTATFTVDLSPTGKTSVDAIGNPISPAPIAQATFTARDNSTGVLSAGAATTLIHDVTAYVDVLRAQQCGRRQPHGRQAEMRSSLQERSIGAVHTTPVSHRVMSRPLRHRR